MGSIVVDVMLKPEILDPQGQAVGGALPRLGFDGFTDVRQGKRFVLTVEGDVTDAHLESARGAAETLLSNPVIEDVVSVHVLDEGAPVVPAAEPAAEPAAQAEAADAEAEPADAEAEPADESASEGESR
jgi:phosphoribosylformylglycinamidine synthase PurS subunit